MQILILNVVLTKAHFNDEKELEEVQQQQMWMTFQEFNDLLIHHIEGYDKIEIVGNAWHTINEEDNTEKLQQRISELEDEIEEANERVDELEQKLDDTSSWISNVAEHISDAKACLEHVEGYLEEAEYDLDEAECECAY